MMMTPLPGPLALPSVGNPGNPGDPAGPPPLLTWRIDAEPYAGTWHSGLGAERFGGRWNPKGLRAVYCSLDPATCLVEAAVHRDFDVLDTRPHVLSCLLIAPLSAVDIGVRVVMPDELPNPAWLQGGTPSAGQQRFGAALLAAHGVLVLPSAVSKCSWNLVFSPEVAAGRFVLRHQQRLVVDTRLNAPQ